MKSAPRLSIVQPEASTDSLTDNFVTLRLILKKPTTQRNSKSVQSLVSFVRHIKFFTEVRNQLSEDAVVQCCHYMTYEFFKKGQYVFRQGEQGAKFYVILEGECGVMVRGELETTEVAVMSRGDSFGELGLLNNKGRAASIICKVDTHLAVLSKDDYERILLKIHQQKMSEKVDFLMALPFFGLCTNYAMQKLSYFFQEVTVARKQAIARCGDPVTSLYFVRSGEIQLIKDVHLPLSQVAKGASTRSLTCHIEVALLSKGECIGFEEAVYSKTHQYTALCYSTTATLLVISKEVGAIQDFVKRVNAEDALKHAEVLLEDKKQKYQNRINSVQQIYQQNQKRSIHRLVDSAADSDSMKVAEQRLKSLTVSDYHKHIALPERRVKVLESMQLYPRKAVTDRSGVGKWEKEVRTASWDVLLTRRSEKSTVPQSKSSPRTVNIHTTYLKQKKMQSFTNFAESLSLASITALHTARDDSSRHCLTINSRETVADFSDDVASTTPLRLDRVTGGSGARFRVTRPFRELL